MKLGTTSLLRGLFPAVFFAALVLGQVSALAAVNYVSGDFNGDGIADLIIVTASGSYEYLGLSGGGFRANAWVRNDLPLGHVQYVSGDFNGDRISDLIIVTASGSYEYLGLPGGGFRANVWVRHDLHL